MLASILNTPISVQASVQVVRAFVRLREMLVTNKALADKLAELERKVASHDEHIQSLFEAIRQFMEPPEKGDGPSGSMSRRQRRCMGNGGARHRGDRDRPSKALVGRGEGKS